VPKKVYRTEVYLKRLSGARVYLKSLSESLSGCRVPAKKFILLVYLVVIFQKTQFIGKSASLSDCRSVVYLGCKSLSDGRFKSLSTRSRTPGGHPAGTPPEWRAIVYEVQSVMRGIALLSIARINPHEI